ncbi:MAG: outer membrane lipoprotein carrier protein LolA [Crocinitomicaceae bacterium]|nr:outer membrane lipoprotein carrier protein LolA [Crocinitomicaceae bacterium]
MRKFLLLIFLFGALGANAQSYTRIKDPTDCKKKINASATNTLTISAKFKEEVFSSMFNSTKIGTGILKYKKDNKIRWEHFAPKKQIVLINGTKVRMQEDGHEVKNAASNQIIKKVQSLMIQLFSGEFLNEREFKISYFENSESYKLILVPKSSRMSKYIASVEMIFNKKTLKLSQMTLKESDADKIVYSFSNVTFNGELSDTNFTKF